MTETVLSFHLKRLNRTLNAFRSAASKTVRFSPSPGLQPLEVLRFDGSQSEVDGPSTLQHGGDSDTGGLSTRHFTPVYASSSKSTLSDSNPSSFQPTTPTTPLVPKKFSSYSPPTVSTSASSPQSPSTSPLSHLSFHGNLSLSVPPQHAGKLRTGWASFRTRHRQMLWGEECWDFTDYTHLRLVVGYRGWEGWRNRWYCNIQTDGPIITDLFQHRLHIPSSPSSTSSRSSLDPKAGPPVTFHTLHIPFKSFVLTNCGTTSGSQLKMFKERIRTVGFGLLGCGRGEEGMPIPRALPRQLRESNRGKREDRSKAGVVRLGDEGYFELCVKSVEAVVWDPLSEDTPDYAKGFDRPLFELPDVPVNAR